MKPEKDLHSDTSPKNRDPLSFSKAELERYSRHLILPGFTMEGQRKLKAARVLVVGAGGLGSPLLQYLAAAGIGTLGIIDHDRVDDSNLQRQVLYDTGSVGKLKVEEAKKRIESMNPFIRVHTHQTRLTSENALDIIRDYDVVADGTDNFPTRYLVNDACVLLDKPNVYASIFQFEGQVSVFNYVDKAGKRGPNYRDLFPVPPPPGSVPSCAEGGVIGVLPGIIGSIQALEVLKVVSGVGEPLSGRLFIFDGLSFQTRVLKVSPDPENPLNGAHPTQTALIDYVQFCGMEEDPLAAQAGIPEISANELASLLKQKDAKFQLIDVREPYEREIASIGGDLIPIGSLPENVEKIRRDVPVILYCRVGIRSADALRLLQSDFGFQNLRNLKGGIIAYAKEVDDKLAAY